MTILETDSNIFRLNITSFIIIGTKGHFETEFEEDFFRAKYIMSLFSSLSGQVIIKIVKLLIMTEIIHLWLCPSLYAESNEVFYFSSILFHYLSIIVLKSPPNSSLLVYNFFFFNNLIVPDYKMIVVSGGMFQW